MLVQFLILSCCLLTIVTTYHWDQLKSERLASNNHAGTKSCEIREHNKFLKYICSGENIKLGEDIVFKCSNADSYYSVSERHGFSSVLFTPHVSDLCPDSNFYQRCGLIPKRFTHERTFWRFNNSEIDVDYACGVFCKRSFFEDWKLSDPSKVCISGNSCSHDVRAKMESDCKAIKDSKRCDGICDDGFSDWTLDCVDERNCNGFQYGFFCPKQKGPFFGSRERIFVNGYDFICADGGRVYDPCINSKIDEALCALKPNTNNNITYCKPSKKAISQNEEFTNQYILDSLDPDSSIALFNFSRCGPLAIRVGNALTFTTICDGFQEQTNCTDLTKVGLYCKIDGFISSVAKQVICNGQLKQQERSICDDGLDLVCHRLSESCYLHKHQLCDGISDCWGDIDELNNICKTQLEINCSLRFKNRSKIPVGWVRDGISDCMDGEDERDNIPSCGQGDTLRYVNADASASCSEVYLNLCHVQSNRKFVEFSELCYSKESCGNDLRVCRMSRRQHRAFTSPVQIEGVELLHICLPGLEELHFMANSTCELTRFLHPDHNILGRNKYPTLYLARKKLDCRYLFGSIYIYLHCLELCENSVCPLKNVVKYDSCQEQFPDRVYTLANNSYLTFLIKKSTAQQNLLYHNDVFPCDNGFCVEYDKVCNLVDDCGDGTDEVKCTNYNKCEKSGEMLTFDRVCDGIVDCKDLSDECNDRCHKRMIKNLGLQITSGVVGILAFLLNSFIIPTNLFTLKDCKSGDSLSNSVLLILVSFGDLLVGLYILIVLSYDIHFGNQYCKMQFKWLTSKACNVIGVLSTVGFLVSVLSVTALSVLRAFKIKRCTERCKKPSEVTRQDIMVIVVIVVFVTTFASLFAGIPLIKTFDDLFVNGIYYGEENTLFIGAPGKSKHIDILKEYYGRLKIKENTLDWGIITNLVSGMFSKDYSGIKHKALHFYGNDAVCLFKYFATLNDPQHIFVWATLSLHVLCLVIISLSYFTMWRLTIAASSALLRGESKETALQKQIKKRNMKLQRKVSLIIISNLMCWVPFLLASILHASQIIDANPYYAVFSLILLPINSVINPIILNNLIVEKLQAFLKDLKVVACSYKHRLWNPRKAKEQEELKNSTSKIVKGLVTRRAEGENVAPRKHYVTRNIRIIPKSSIGLHIQNSDSAVLDPLGKVSASKPSFVEGIICCKQQVKVRTLSKPGPCSKVWAHEIFLEVDNNSTSSVGPNLD